MATRPDDLIYAVDEWPPWPKLVLLGLQQAILSAVYLVLIVIVARAARAPAETAMSMVSLGMIAVAISTGGASPALAQRLRDDIAGVVRPEHATLARRLRDLRPWAKETFATYEERRDYFQHLVEAELS